MSILGHVLVLSVLALIVLGLVFGIIMIMYSEQKREQRGFMYNLFNKKDFSYFFHVFICIIFVVMQGILIFYLLE